MKVKRHIQEKMDALEDAFGGKGSIEMLCELDGMIALPQTPGWLEAITRKRDLIQGQLNEWSKQQQSYGEESERQNEVKRVYDK